LARGKSLALNGNLYPVVTFRKYSRKSQEKKKKRENRDISEINTLEDTLINSRHFKNKQRIPKTVLNIILNKEWHR
jgi:hypothetical protein